MKKTLRILTRIPLGLQLFILMAVPVLVVLILLNMHNYTETARFLKQDYTESALTLANKNNQLLDTNYDPLVRALSQILDISDEDLIRENNTGQEAIRRVLNNTGAIVANAYLISTDGMIYSSNMVNYLIVGNPYIDSIVEQARESEMQIFVSPPYSTPLSSYTVALVQCRKQRACILELKLSMLQSLTDPYAVHDSQSYVVMDRYGNAVFFGQQTDMLPVVQYSMPSRLNAEFVHSIADLSGNIGNISYDNDSYTCIRSSVNRFGWYTAAIIDESSMSPGREYILKNLVQICIIVLLLILLNTLVMSFLFTRPIEKLSRQMKAAQISENNQLLLPVTRKDVIGDLTESYNILLQRVGALIADIKHKEDEKRRYAFLILQNQISPHFLNNTLICINNMAKHGSTDKVIVMNRALSSILRYCMDLHTELVTFQEEIQIAEEYMQIQNMRYGDIFSLSVSADNDAQAYLIPKMTLQPLVENAVSHGLLPMHTIDSSRCLEIHIEAVIASGKFQVAVSDNGCGIEEYELSKLKNTIKPSSDFAANGHIGITNVAHRVWLSFGDTAGFSLDSSPMIGTTVRLLLPIHSESDR